jgi:hypothetical protein
MVHREFVKFYTAKMKTPKTGVMPKINCVIRICGDSTISSRWLYIHEYALTRGMREKMRAWQVEMCQ